MTYEQMLAEIAEIELGYVEEYKIMSAEKNRERTGRIWGMVYATAMMFDKNWRDVDKDVCKLEEKMRG